MQEVTRWSATTMGFVGLGTAASFAPWSYSGARGRSSFELIRVGERLFLLDDGLPGAVAVLWKSLPLLAAAALLLLVFLPPLWGRIVSLGFALLLGSGAFGVVALSDGPLRVGWGAKAAFAVALVVFVLAAAGPRRWLRASLGAPSQRSELS